MLATINEVAKSNETHPSLLQRHPHRPTLKPSDDRTEYGATGLASDFHGTVPQL
ncbi:hypothetical protein [Acaryochloris marina]|uniref:hypothetical protein n=1 Tax=Acaryochloris marina TaxID=155978 RepID=UPI0002EBEAF2|nr:hypothetical protein [Acaryochloris marina]